MSRDLPRRVALIGGGFSGVMVLWHLLQQTTERLHVRLYADGALVGRGLAYGTTDPCHLLNVPTGRMSALPHRQDHFLDWLHRAPDRWRGLAPDYAALPVTETTFMPRQVYGAYLQALLEDARASALHTLEIVPTRATGLAPSGGVIGADGLWAADSIVLATGPVMATPFALPDHPGALATPWGGALDRFWQWYDGETWTAASRLALLGTGLTAVDMVLSLVRRGFPGQIVACSRHGDWPAAHDLTTPPVPWPQDLRPTTAPALRQAVETALAAAGDTWRGVIDGCRPVINSLWGGLPDAEKALFYRDSFSWWNVRRHRMPEGSAATLAALTTAGRLVTRAGAVTGVAASGGACAVMLAEGEHLPVAGVISTLGLSFDLRHTRAPLLQDALRQGFVRPGPAGFGVAVTDGHTAFHGEGWQLLTLGQLLFGERFETTAVPELRQQAADVAALILAAPRARGRTAA